MNRKNLTISLVFSVVLMVSTSLETTGTVPITQLGERMVKVEDASTSKWNKRISKELKLQSELKEKYKNAFNRLVEDCSNWRQKPGSSKPIDTGCKNLIRKMSIARTNAIKQDELVNKFSGNNIMLNFEKQRRRLPLPMNAETLKRNQVRIDDETKLVQEFDQEFNSTLSPILGNCRKEIEEDPAIPTPSDAVCKKLSEKVRNAASKLIEQAELLEKLRDELPLAARKNQMPQCDGFYLSSGTFIAIPDCLLGEVPWR